jgi:2-iminobutanoate/2-iminopropanoate deaminase
MPRQTIATSAAPGSPLYSQGVRAGSTIYVSGMVGMDVATGEMAGSTIQEQTRQALRNCVAVIEAGGGTQAHIVHVMVLLANPSDFDGMNEEYARAFPADPPTRAVAKLGVELPNVLVSILMTAQLET